LLQEITVRRWIVVLGLSQKSSLTAKNAKPSFAIASEGEKGAKYTKLKP
jgi:hypothetical protein